MNITNMETNNMNIRERFEEIWPVPEGIEWADDQYVTIKGTPKITIELIDRCVEWDARLDTFTRCQETIAAVDQRGAEMRGLLEETSKAILRHQAEQPMSRRLAGLLTKARAKVDRYLKAAAAQHTESGVGE